jgi:RNA 3'-terminal phosphate cyclase (ATP)
MSQTLLELDGSLGEGGGQILRSSLSLSLLTGRAFRLVKVRAGRPKPGLQPQHLQSVRAAAAIGNATVKGDHLGSSELTFEPGTVQAGSYQFDIGTAGATGLVLHTLYLPLALRGSGPSELTLIGGTHVQTSPCYHFLERTWLPYMCQCGLKLSLKLVRPGYYPRGGGVVQAFLQPVERLQGVQLLERGPVKATGFSAVAGLPDSIASRQARQASKRLKAHGLKVDIKEQSWPGGPCSILALELNTSPAPTLFFALGARGKPSEAVADEAADQVIAYLDRGPALVDPHSSDQLVLPLALAEGPSCYHVTEVTRHLNTNIAVIQRFVEREIRVEGEEGQPGTVRIG